MLVESEASVYRYTMNLQQREQINTYWITSNREEMGQKTWYTGKMSKVRGMTTQQRKIQFISCRSNGLIIYPWQPKRKEDFLWDGRDGPATDASAASSRDWRDQTDEDPICFLTVTSSRCKIHSHIPNLNYISAHLQAKEVYRTYPETDRRWMEH